MEVARWAKERGCPWDEDTCADAAEGGHLKMLQWLRANGCSVGRVDLHLCRGRRPPGGAAVGARERRSVGRGYLRHAAVAATWRCCSGRARTDVRGTSDLRQCRERRPPGGAAVGARERAARGTMRTCSRAAGGGHLEVLQWARSERLSVGRGDLLRSRARRPPGGVAVGARERRSVGRVHLRQCRGRRPPGGAAVGARERRSVGRVHLRRCRGWRPPGGAPVGARERRSVGRVHLRLCRAWRPPGGAAVGARERLSVGRVHLRLCRGWRLTWRCCSGRARTALRGTRRLAAMPRKAATWRCCSGRERSAHRGIRCYAKLERGTTCTRMWCGGYLRR